MNIIIIFAKNSTVMLTRFAVKNYMGFPERIIWDLASPRDYSFNPHLVKDGVIKNGIIYGVNGSGKSSLGKAVFDIVTLANHKFDYASAIYRGRPQDTIDFEYSFLLGDDKVDYNYSKTVNGTIVKELLKTDEKVYLSKDGSEIFINEEFPIDPGMKEKLYESYNSISLINFLYASMPLGKEHVIYKLMSFVKSMLWFRCLDERNYIGIDENRVFIEEYIIKHGYINDLADFLLSESGQRFDFSPTTLDNKIIICKIGEENVPLGDIMSTGTRSLELLFYWTKRMAESDVKFVFIDEFDAFYHFELSINVCKTLFAESFQAFLTSHNTMLLQNDFLRPDCAFRIKDGKVKALSELTNRGELREGHNIEKMYRAGAFDR